jgi:hypothetical protein
VGLDRTFTYGAAAGRAFLFALLPTGAILIPRLGHLRLFSSLFLRLNFPL